jgi:hypothetical protein
MPARERRSASQRETRERATKNEDIASNSLSKLITRKEATDGRKHNKSEARNETSKGQRAKTQEREQQQLKTSSILNTHPTTRREDTRPYPRET